MARILRRVAVPAAAALLLVGACGDDLPASSDTGDVTLVPGDGSGTADPSPEPTSPSNEEVLERLAREVAEDQRPGDFQGVANVTVFDDPEGCASGEAAFVTVELSGDPSRGEILFCRIPKPPGWELSQGILYGE